MQGQRRPHSGKLATTGFTLLELLSACAISAILVTFSSYTLKIVYITQLNLATANLTSMVHTARSIALSRKLPVIICPTTDQTTCAENWKNSAIIFIDENSNKVQDSDEPSVALIDLPEEIGSLSWVAFGGKTNLTFTSDGFTDNQNGRFYICPTKLEPIFLRQLIIHKSGRPRFASPAEIKHKHCKA